MKEKIFRGKRIDNGEWVYGDYLDRLNPRIKSSDTEYEVDSQTVGRCIGRKSKNGSKIFEGDICYEKSVGCEAYGYREFTIEKWFIISKFYTHSKIDVKKIKERRGNYALGWNKLYDGYFGLHEVRCGIDIVGNIYDNPEIIEDAKSFDWTDKYKDD